MPQIELLTESGIKLFTYRTQLQLWEVAMRRLQYFAGGKNLPPFNISKRKTLPKGDKLSATADVIIRYQEKGWVNNVGRSGAL